MQRIFCTNFLKNKSNKMALEKTNQKEKNIEDAKSTILSIFNQPRLTTDKDELLTTVLELLYLQGNKSGFLEQNELKKK